MLRSIFKRLPAATIGCALALSAASCDRAAERIESVPESTREIRVITSGGFTAAYKILGPEFEKPDEAAAEDETGEQPLVEENEDNAP